MPQDFSEHRSPPAAGPKLDDAIRDILQNFDQLGQPHKRSLVISWVWVINGILALTLAFFLGYFLGESRTPASFLNAMALVFSFLLGFSLRRS
jgi:hypothetical protein